MSKSWPLVSLGEVVSYRKEFIRIDDLETYKRCRVQLHAQGIILRDVVSGAEIKTKEQQVCRTGEFLVAEIDAKVGGWLMNRDTTRKPGLNSRRLLTEIGCRLGDSAMSNLWHLGRLVEARNWQEIV